MSTTLPARPATEASPRFRPGPRRVVPALWLFAMLCYLYCDVLGLYRAEDLAALLTGEIGGVRMTDGFLLGAAVLMTIPITALLLALVAPHPVARWTSVGAGVVMTLVQASTLTFGTAPTSAYLWFSALEITTTATITWYAVARWRRDADLA
ncbi:hypothetical protein JQN72_18085 [Phycicoccus sp. CSK15P-2]|uniref:DUF6326 family protein n=1 Tax=Phycicoccus sp. CSK15P-2 TaxID=2807627 RepID=UPI00194EB55E|nr:DUF6326 family protein [Phycicoccus sp. CSK15P-2]MBM6406147.1 hypothetical protein [Phycicoccus sp. CSK15P-2]